MLSWKGDSSGKKKKRRIQRRSLKCHKAAGLNVQLLQTSLLLAVGGLASCYSAENLVHKITSRITEEAPRQNLYFLCVFLDAVSASSHF